MGASAPLAARFALVTGASSGIGAATVRRLVAAGATVIAHGQDERRLTAIAQETGAHPVKGDLADAAALDALTDAVLNVAGRLDILVCNAGVGWSGRLTTMADREIDRLVRVNLLAPMALTHKLLPGMLRSEHGRLIYVTSIAGRTGVADEAVYAATKAGLDAFAESLRFELAGTTVRVGVVVPGVVDTPYFDRRLRPYRRSRPRPIPPEQVAAVIETMARTGRAERFVPRWLAVPAGLRATLPRPYRMLARRFGGS